MDRTKTKPKNNSPGLVACSNPFVPFSRHPLFLSCFFFLSAALFLLMTRARTWGHSLGALAPENWPPELDPRTHFLLKIVPWDVFLIFGCFWKVVDFSVDFSMHFSRHFSILYWFWVPFWLHVRFIFVVFFMSFPTTVFSCFLDRF